MRAVTSFRTLRNKTYRPTLDSFLRCVITRANAATRIILHHFFFIDNTLVDNYSACVDPAVIQSGIDCTQW